MQKLLEDHWQASLRVVRYLKGTPDQGIMLRAESNMKITAYCDADRSSCPSSRRFLSVYAVFFCDSLVSWKTKKATNCF